MRMCEAPNCDAVGRGGGNGTLCERHYYRMRKFGSFDLPAPAVCAAEECEVRAKTRGYCGVHSERIRRHGDPDVLLVIHEGPERFMTYVEKTASCWLWRGTLTWDGYGLFRDKNRRSGAHRFAYEFFVGPIPKGLQVDHLCRVRNCVNPSHLEPVTAAENNRRKLEAAK